MADKYNGITIKIFLVDGIPNGLIKCTNDIWNVVAYKIPRTDLEKCKDREHLKYSGIYFLLGKTDDEERDVVYIGQAKERKNGEGILCRLQEHVRSEEKDYWTEAIVFTNENNSLGPTEVSYLENRFCAIAKDAKRYIVKNSNDPNLPNITEEKECELEKFIEYARIVVGVLGHKVFEKINGKKENISSIQGKTNTINTDVIFYLEVKSDIDSKAMGKRTSDGFTVFIDSYISKNESDSLQDVYRNLRKKHSGAISNDGKLTEDIPFNSPSAAACFVLGRSANGYTEWKTEDGKTLKDFEKEISKE